MSESLNQEDLMYLMQTNVKTGVKVNVGDVIGKSQSLESQYPKEKYPHMKNHIHLQV